MLDASATKLHPDVAMNNRASLADAARLIRNARAAGFNVKTEVSEIGGYTMHSIPMPRNPYMGGFTHVIVMVDHPRRGYRSSVRVTTTKHYDNTSEKSVTRNGLWDANYAIRETAKDLASWNRHLGVISGSLESSGL